MREREVAELVEAVRDELGLTAQARERFRMDVLRRFYEDYGARLGGLAWRDFGEIERAAAREGVPRRGGSTASGPRSRPEALVRTLLTQRAALAEAADGILDAPEQALLAAAARAASAGARPTSRSSTRRTRCWTSRRARSGT